MEKVITPEKVSYRAYKDGKQWVTAVRGLGGAVVVAGLVMTFGNVGSASADSVVGDNADQSATTGDNQTTDGNAAIVSANQSKTTYVSSSATVEDAEANLDSAVSNAENAGVTVQQDSNATETIMPGDSASVASSLASNYDSQADNINSTVAEQNSLVSAGSSAVNSVNDSVSSVMSDAASAGISVSSSSATISPNYVTPADNTPSAIASANAVNESLYNSAVAELSSNAANYASELASLTSSYSAATSSYAAAEQQYLQDSAAAEAANNATNEAANNLPTTIDVGHNGIQLHINQQTGEVIFTGIKTQEDLDWVKSRVVVNVSAEGATLMDGTIIEVHHVSGGAYQGALVGGNIDNSVFTSGSGHAHDNDSYDVFTFGDGGFYLIPVTVGDMDTPTGPNSGPIEQHVDISTSNGSISYGPVTGPDGSLDGNTDSHGSLVHWFDWTNSVSIHGYVQDNVDIGNNITIFGDGKAQVDVETVVVPPTEPTKPDVPSTSFVFQDVVAPSLVAAYQKTDVKVPSMDPTKDVVVSVSDQTSLNNAEIALGQIFDYELNSSVRPAGYDGTTTEWSMPDQLDIVHDQFTGEWQVYTNSDIVMPDGSVIKAGSEISKYFSESYDAETGTFKISMNNELMSILNLPENKAIAQSWSAYIQAKRIAPGTVYNTFDESYNNWKVQSNRVETFTPEPEKPVTPKPTEPAEPAEPAKPIETSAPVTKQAAGVVALPETGAEKHNGLTAAGMAIGLALLGTSAMMKRRKDEEN